MKNGGNDLRFTIKDSPKVTILNIEWPESPGPFHWRITKEGISIKGRDEEWSVPFKSAHRKKCVIYMTYEKYDAPEFLWGLLTPTKKIGNIELTTPMDGLWRGENGEPLMEEAYSSLSKSSREAPWPITVKSYGNRESGDLVVGCPPFKKPFPFKAKLDPEGGWIVLESEDGEGCCVDLLDTDGRAKCFGEIGLFERMSVVLDDLRDEVPPWSTKVVLPRDWDPRAWARKWSDEAR